MANAEQRIIELEERLAHLEMGLEQLTTFRLQQERVAEEIQGQLDYIKGLLQEVAPSSVVSEDQETPPPHY